MSAVKNIPVTTCPLYENDARQIAALVRSYSRDQLQMLLQVSNKLTDINYARFQDFEDDTIPAKPAILAYTGSVFQHIRPLTFSPDDYRYAQDHVRIMSILYGLLRPLDLIKAYRLPYKIKLKGMPEKDLYAYWKPKLTDTLIRDIQKSGNILINLASLDVQEALEMDKLEKEVKIITPEFKEFRNGKYETIRTYAKMARGEMTRYILENRIETPGHIRRFQWDGFRYVPELSDESHYIFVQEK